MSGGTRAASAAAVALAVAGLVAVVARGADANVLVDSDRPSGTALTSLDALAAGGVGAGLLYLALRGLAALPAIDRTLSRWIRPGAPERVLWTRAGVTIACGAALVLAAVLWPRVVHTFHSTPTVKVQVKPRNQPAPASGQSAGPTTTLPSGPERQQREGFRPPLLIAGILLVAAGVAYVAWERSLRRRRGAPEEEDQAPLAEAIDLSLEELRAERDPRRAVIAAYAEMEHSLALSGVPREPFETPREFLGRILARAGAAGADARTLTDLFQLARFSRHPIDERMRRDAIAALESVRAGTAAPA